MKGLSIWQPHAQLIASGAKTIETRGKRISYRGPLAIHASKRVEAATFAHFARNPGLRAALWPHDPLRPEATVPFGAVVAVAELVDCLRVEDIDFERLFGVRRWPNQPAATTWREFDLGNYSPGRYGWMLANVRALALPVPFAGRQSLFEVPDEVLL